jgi:predicted deacylase
MSRTAQALFLFEEAVKNCKKMPDSVPMTGQAATSSELLRQCVKSAKTLGMRIIKLPHGGVALHHEGGPTIFSITSGVHGEERAGPYFLRDQLARWAEKKEQIPPFSFLIVPIVNIEGWDDGYRRPDDDAEINMGFHKNGAAKESAFITALWKQFPPPTLFWDIHQDVCSTHSYVWTHKGKRADPFNAALADHLHVPIQPWKGFTGATDSFMRRHGVPFVTTTEVPPTWDFDKRVRWIRRAYVFMVRWLKTHQRLGGSASGSRASDASSRPSPRA